MGLLTRLFAKKCDWCEEPLPADGGIEVGSRRFCSEAEARQALRTLRKRGKGDCGGCH